MSSDFYAPTKLFVVIGWQGAFREEGTGIWTAVINHWALHKVPYKCKSALKPVTGI